MLWLTSLTTLETYTKYNTLIYVDCRQVEQPGLGTGIFKACATRMQAISAGFEIFLEGIRSPTCQEAPGLSPASPIVNPGLITVDKYEYWKGKCVKSVLGEFSFGISVCRNKGTQSDLGPPFRPGPLPGGGEGGQSGTLIPKQAKAR